MTGYVALLRGINVAGRNKLAMATLREVAEGLGYTTVSTHLASGNLLLDAGKAPRAAVETAVHDALLERTGLDLPVVARDLADLRAVVAANPYPDAEPSRLHVCFLTGEPSAAAVPGFDQEMARHPERGVVLGREVYLDYVHAAGRTRLDWKKLERGLGVQGTARNWRTVLALLDKLGGQQ